MYVGYSFGMSFTIVNVTRQCGSTRASALDITDIHIIAL